MQVTGKCKIANKWVNNQIDKDSFDFENKGKVAKGRLTWADMTKGKDGAKDTFTNTTKKFVCFGANIDFIEQNLGQQFVIVGNLKTNQFTDGEGKVVKYDEIIINEVGLAEKKEVSKHSQDKANGYAPESNHVEEDLDQEIPF